MYLSLLDNNKIFFLMLVICLYLPPGNFVGFSDVAGTCGVQFFLIVAFGLKRLVAVSGGMVTMDITLFFYTITAISF